jgi:metal-responsive CopG/Arc/MetJ family transcriptional regulator
MNNDQEPKPVMVVLTTDLAARSLEAANAAGISRSELVRQLLADYLTQDTEH